ncbi:MAG: nucleotidyl transferase AbiEii/AbiGii toxin family protein [Candidatus Omnitrophota bacterium]
MTYNALQLRELFHLEFLRWFGRKVKAEFYALKGGVNLRFFFNSFRYSEDMDLDIKGVEVDILKDVVMKILQALSFQDTLKPFGIERVVPPNISKAKQTETTQRFKIHLITYAGEDLFTKVEFSRRGFKGKAVVQPASDAILRAYKLAPLLLPHYDIQSAVLQKIEALTDRPRQSILTFIKKLNRPVFTTHELAASSGKSLSAVTQALNFLSKQGLIFKLYRGVWAEAGNKRLSPYTIIPFLFPRYRVYVSFISALHLYGIIEQIPQEINLASLAHTKMIRTKVGVFSIHRITASFFNGFNWYKGTGSFLIAEPEKALIDCLYLSSYRKKQFGYFPELHFPKSFSFREARKWVKKIRDPKARIYVQKKLDALLK